jgi:hypothetical protein
MAVTSSVSPHKTLQIILNNTLPTEQKNYCLMPLKQRKNPESHIAEA